MCSSADSGSIVFVHGLRGGIESTWTKDGVTWPRDLLKLDIPQSRIFSFGYDSAVIHSDVAEVTQGNLEDDAKSLCSLLHERRRDTETVSSTSDATFKLLTGFVTD